MPSESYNMTPHRLVPLACGLLAALAGCPAQRGADGPADPLAWQPTCVESDPGWERLEGPAPESAGRTPFRVPFPERIDPFQPPRSVASPSDGPNDRRALSSQAVELKGFAALGPDRKVILRLGGRLHVVGQGDTVGNTTVTAIEPPRVTLTGQHHRRTISLLDDHPDTEPTQREPEPPVPLPREAFKALPAPFSDAVTPADPALSRWEPNSPL